MKVFVLLVSVLAVINAGLFREKLESNTEVSDEWAQNIIQMETEIILHAFDIHQVRGLVKESIEDCARQKGVVTCMGDLVDSVYDVISAELPNRKSRQEAKVVVEAIAEFFVAVHGECENTRWIELKQCLKEVGQKYCAKSDKWTQEECSLGIIWGINKLSDLGLGGMSTSNPWYNKIVNMTTDAFVEAADMKCMTNRIRMNIGYCVRSFDPQECFVHKVDAFCQAFGHTGENMNCDKIRDASSTIVEFILLVHSSCSDKILADVKECSRIQMEVYCNRANVKESSKTECKAMTNKILEAGKPYLSSTKSLEILMKLLKN